MELSCSAGRQWYPAGLMKLAIPNPKHAGVRIDVSQGESNDFASAKARGVQKHNGETHDLRVQAQGAGALCQGTCRQEL